MNKKLLIIIFCLTFFSGRCFTAEQTTISVIFSSDIKPYRQSLDGFKKFLKENEVNFLVSEYGLEKGKSEKIISEINRENPDIVFTLGTKATKLAKEKIHNIPVIFSVVLNHTEIINPNITGVSMDISPKTKLGNIKKVLPKAKRIGVIYSSKSTGRYKEISRACDELGFQLVGKKVSSGKELADALKELLWQIDCFLMVPDSMIYFPQSIEYLLLESLRKKVPVVGLSSFYTEAGALISLDCDYGDIGSQAGEMAVEIIKGKKPGDIRPLGPRKAELSLNLLTAERIGIEIPSAAIREASKIFDK